MPGDGQWRERGPELATLVGLLVSAASLFAFVRLAGVGLAEDVHALDRRLFLALRSGGDPAQPLGPVWLPGLMRDVTALGSLAVTGLVTLATAGWLWLRGQGRMASLVLLAVGGGVAVSFGLKELFDRPRPDLAPHGTLVLSTSFPSGHAMVSALVYFSLAALVARVQPAWRTRLYLLALALLVSGLVGLSRVYLAVHWPSDVLAGWAAGLAWATLAWLVARRLQRSGRVEVGAGGAASGSSGEPLG